MTLIQHSERAELLGNFQARVDCAWANEDAPIRRVLDRALVDTVLDPRFGTPPEAALLVSLAGATAARQLLRAVSRITVFDPSGFAFWQLPASRPGELGITWAQGPTLHDLPASEYQTVVIDHLAMVLFPGELPALLAAVRHVLAPGGLLVMLNARRPLRGWCFGAEVLTAGFSVLAGDTIHQEDLGTELVGVWRP